MHTGSQHSITTISFVQYILHTLKSKEMSMQITTQAWKQCDGLLLLAAIIVS